MLQDGNVKAGPAFCLENLWPWVCCFFMLVLQYGHAKVGPAFGRIYGVQVGYFYDPFLPHTIEGVLR